MWDLKEKLWEIRDPIYGFIEINEWERDIINHPVFQRLRRIRQLAFTDLVYPGAVHTRFEHSLGVMHVATKVFDNIASECKDMLRSEYGLNEDGLNKIRTIIRLAALLHDVGHAPFSHAGESIMPYKDNGKLYKHEDYSSAIIKTVFKELIEDHKLNNNYDIKAEEVAAFVVKDYKVLKKFFFWVDIISGQVDADRIDYLLRDSYHIGVQYGIFDLKRLLKTIVIVKTEDRPILGFKEGGLHVAESLILARYYMFTQVYFHHTRRAYDHHIANAIREILLKLNYSDGKLKPPNNEENIKDYLEWDDWKVGNLIKENKELYDCEKILKREHDRCVYHTNEVPDIDDLKKFDDIYHSISYEIDECFVDEAEKSFYNIGNDDIKILKEDESGEIVVRSLSELSNVVNNIKTVRQKRIYVPLIFQEKAINILKKEGLYSGE